MEIVQEHAYDSHVRRYPLQRDFFSESKEGDGLLLGREEHDREPHNITDNIDRQSSLVAQAFSLSEREREILSLLTYGKTAKTIASDTFISYNTVKTHISHIYQKTGVHTREELIALVIQQDQKQGVCATRQEAQQEQP